MIFYKHWLLMQKSKVIPILLATLLCFLVYRPGLTGYFIFDDTINIIENHHIAINSLDLNSLKRAAFSGESGPLGRPLSMMTFSLNYYFDSLNPYTLKLTNLAIHLLNGLLLFFLTNSLLRSHKEINSISFNYDTMHWISLSTAAAWMLHPFNLTGVLYIVQRMTSLAALFTFSGLLAYVHGRRHILDNPIGWFWIALGIFFFPILAIFSKENGALLPIFILTIELCFFQFKTRSSLEKRALLAIFFITTILPFAFIIYFLATNTDWLLSGYSMREFSLPERLMTETRVIWFYIKMIIAPSISEMGIYHDDINVSKNFFQPISTLFSSCGILILLLSSIFFAKKFTVFTFGILFFLIGHSIESTILALELVHEHRNYLPSYGLLLALFYYLINSDFYSKNINLRIGLSFLLISIFSAVTFLRASQWGDPVLFKIKEVERHPESIRANIAIAAFYDLMPASSQIEANDFYEKAYRYYVTSAELSPSDTLGLFGLIALNSRRGIMVDDSWVNALSGRIELYPFSASTGNAIAALEKCVASGNCKQPPEILETLIKAALRNPTLQGRAKAQVVFAYSDFLFKVKQEPDASTVAAYKAIAVNPNDMDNQMTLISMLVNMGRYLEAAQQIGVARRADNRRLFTQELDTLQQVIDAQPKSN